MGFILLEDLVNLIFDPLRNIIYILGKDSIVVMTYKK